MRGLLRLFNAVSGYCEHGVPRGYCGPCMGKFPVPPDEVDAYLAEMRRPTPFELKQELAQPSRYYGDGGTIHGTNHLHVETRHGKVVAVWFRCQQLPFEQVEVDESRAATSQAINRSGELPAITGVEVLDP